MLTIALTAAMVSCAVVTPEPIVREHIPGPDDISESDSAAVSADAPRTERTAPRPSGAPVMYDGATWYPRPDVSNILLIGVDKDASRHEIGRSDMLILCTIDPNEPSISMLTIPRDTRAYMYKLADDGSVEDELCEKINHAYAYGGGPDKYSAQNTMQAVSRLLSCGGMLSVPIQYYISIDLDGLAELADVFGGIEVTFDQTIPGVGNAGETVNLQGPFVRYYLERRHDMAEGEVSRQKHQQTFMKALFAKIKERGALQSTPALFAIFTKFMKTNLSLPQCLTFAGLLDKLNLDDVRFSRITGEGVRVDDVWYLEPDEQETVRLVLDNLYAKS